MQVIFSRTEGFAEIMDLAHDYEEVFDAGNGVSLSGEYFFDVMVLGDHKIAERTAMETGDFDAWQIVGSGALYDVMTIC